LEAWGEEFMHLLFVEVGDVDKERAKNPAEVFSKQFKLFVKGGNGIEDFPFVAPVERRGDELAGELARAHLLFAAKIREPFVVVCSEPEGYGFRGFSHRRQLLCMYTLFSRLLTILTAFTAISRNNRGQLFTNATPVIATG